MSRRSAQPGLVLPALAGHAVLTALVWRVAQEAIRNALRHGQPSSLDVRVGVEGSVVRLVVADDGAGFDVQTSPQDGHLGLRALRDLVGELGGSLDVRSAPGAGTTVLLEVGT